MSSFDDLSTAGDHSHDTGATREFPPPDVDVRPSIPERIGPYTIRSVLGEGGFGIVMLAEQKAPIARQVAVKLIKPGMDSAAVIARFEAERQALALMDHPCVAKVIDGGTTDAGLPYFVMEYVPGLPITKFCREQKLDIDARLALFEQVCDAVQHAHQKGIIHRDLKPSNILVALRDGKPAPKVIDFGIAKALHQRLTEKTIFTRDGVFIGTPEYMAPEQAGATGIDIDTRADVYSLGVILYELLTGARPFDSASLRAAGFAEIQRIIREVDPPRPSTRLSEIASSLVPAAPDAREQAQTRSAIRRLRRDLDWVVMRCLEKERERRYPTASAIAEEIARVRRFEPVEAGPPSVGYRASKFIRRHRTAVAAGAIVVVALLVATAVSTAFGVSEARQREITQTALDNEEAAHRQTEDALAREEQARQQTQEALAREEAARKTSEQKERVARTVITFLNEDLLTAADPDADGPEARVLDVLDRAGENVGDRFRDDPAVEAEVRAAIGSAYVAVGAPDKARPHLERAAELFEQLGASDSIPAIRVDVSLAETLWRREMADEALAVITDAIERHEARRGPDAAPDKLLLDAKSELASAHKYAGRAEEADALYREVLAGQLQVLGPDHRDTINTRYNLGLLPELRTRDEQGEARTAGVEQSFEELSAAYEDARRALGRDNPLTLTIGTEVAAMLNRLDRFDEAIDTYRRLMPVMRTRLGDDHWRTRQFLANYGRLLQKMERHEEAVQILEAALTGYKRDPGPAAPDTQVVTLWTARSQYLIGEKDRAERTLQTAAEDMRRLGREGSAAFQDRIADLYESLGDQEARDKWRGSAFQTRTGGGRR